jgi:hypothetical protein
MDRCAISGAMSRTVPVNPGVGPRFILAAQITVESKTSNYAENRLSLMPIKPWPGAIQTANLLLIQVEPAIVESRPAVTVDAVSSQTSRFLPSATTLKQPASISRASSGNFISPYNTVPLELSSSAVRGISVPGPATKPLPNRSTPPPPPALSSASLPPPSLTALSPRLSSRTSLVSRRRPGPNSSPPDSASLSWPAI